MSITVVLAEDNALLRHGLARLIGSATDLELVGAAADLPRCLELVDEHAPDVVVTDIRMPPTHTDAAGLVLSERAIEKHPVHLMIATSGVSGAFLHLQAHFW